MDFVLGWAISRLIARIDDYLIDHTDHRPCVWRVSAGRTAPLQRRSGCCGGRVDHRKFSPKGMSPTTRIVLYNFWEYITFLVNSLVFLLIGLEVDLNALLLAWKPISIAIGAVLLARVIVVYGLSWITGKLSEPISLRWRHVLAWGGLRGALSLALALSLPAAFGPDRELLRTMAFGVALFTLLIQATTMSGLVRRLGIIMKDPLQIDYEQRHARLNALRSAETHVERRYREGLISAPAWERIKPKLQEQTALLADSLRELLRVEPKLEEEELDITQERSSAPSVLPTRVCAEMA